MTMKPRKPDRNVVVSVFESEAKRARSNVTELLGNGLRKSKVITQARRRAILRIIANTGCSIRGLANTWGVNHRGVAGLFSDVAGPYDPQTISRLAWSHSSGRAVEIVKGTDARTEADLAAWRRLGTVHRAEKPVDRSE